ncbi:MAG: hypothetical protein HUJ65_06700, partial [Oscillospiraceae bacterium]|nr:hypothetical protein [Oscillospiraceae bacterium]
METYEGHELYRLTDSQMALVLDSMGSSEDKQNRTNAEGIYYLDRNGFSVTAMVRAVNLIVEQNDTLRLRIVKYKGKKRQLFGDYKPFELPVINVPDIDGVRRAIDGCRELVVGLRGERLWEGRIITAEDGSGAVVLRFNHLCIDGYTLDMILRFIIKYYGALKNGEEPVLEKTGSYRDYIEYESRYLASERCRDDAQWWKNVYKNRFFSRFCIPTGFRTKAERAAIIEKAAGKELSDEVDAYAHSTGNSAASLFLAAAALLTQKLTRKNHFQIFTLVHGRSTAVQRRTMGCMVGTAQIEYKIDESVTVDEYLDACCKSYLESMQHSKYFAQRCAGYMIIEDIFHGFNFST